MTMDYKEKYQNALERAKKGLPIDEVFPELKESEDEGIRRFIIYCISELQKANTENAKFNARCGEAISYLEKQKEQKPAEWSEEDEKMCQHIISDLREFRDCKTDEELISDYGDEISWLKNRLKSLRPQPHWKPSDEQMIKDSEARVPRWKNIDEEKPRRGEGCACITVTVDGHIKYTNFEEGPWYWDDSEGFRGYNNYGDKEYHTCSYWMPWDKFFGVLERQFKK